MYGHKTDLVRMGTEYFESLFGPLFGESNPYVVWGGIERLDASVMHESGSDVVPRAGNFLDRSTMHKSDSDIVRRDRNLLESRVADGLDPFSVVDRHLQVSHPLEHLQVSSHIPRTDGDISSIDEVISCWRYSQKDIKKATNNFAEANIVGYGGFGKVYQGFMSTTSHSFTVAVKRLHELSKQGTLEFKSEIDVLSKCKHRHIVSLLGYCDELGEKMLVYEYMPRGSLFNCLHQVDTSFLTMEQRLKICIGVGRGLDYLHNGTSSKVIHRDIKTANILLDENWVAKISDLGLSRASAWDHPSSAELTSTARGTRGYIDPEYRRTKKPSKKFDVYSFGVVFLEVLCRRPALDRQVGCCLADWALPYIQKGSFHRIIDPNLKEVVPPFCSQACALIIAQCLDDDPRRRPTMSRVVADLESALALQLGTYPSSSVDDSEILNHFNRPR